MRFESGVTRCGRCDELLTEHVPVWRRGQRKDVYLSKRDGHETSLCAWPLNLSGSEHRLPYDLPPSLSPADVASWLSA